MYVRTYVRMYVKLHQSSIVIKSDNSPKQTINQSLLEFLFT